MKFSFVALILLYFSTFAFAQNDFRAPNPEIKLILGSSAFLDEEIPFDHFLIGGSIQFHLSEHLSIGPQLLYMKGPGSDKDYTVSGDVIYELTPDQKIVVYAVGGAGLFRHTNRFGANTFSANEWTASGGIGAKIFVTNRLYFAPEFRFGWEPLMTTQVGIGFSF